MNARTLTMSPSLECTLATTPPKRLVISTVALSLCTSHTRSKGLMTSPSCKKKKVKMVSNMSYIQQTASHTQCSAVLSYLDEPLHQLHLCYALSDISKLKRN